MISIQQESKIKSLSWTILIILAVIWGTSFILIKKGLMYFSGMEVGALRIVIAFLVLLPFAFTRIKQLSWRDWKFLFLSSVTGSGIPAFLFALAQKGIDSSLAGILNSLTPLFTMLIGVAFFSLRVRWFNAIGVLIAFIGALGLISVSGGKSFDFNIQYAIYIIVATICYAINVNILKNYLHHVHYFTITIFSFFIIGIPVLLYLLIFTGFLEKIISTPEVWKGVGYISILSIVGTAMALVAFNKLVKLSSPVFAASVTYLIPIVALFWGIADGEIISWSFLIWIIMILTGIYLVNQVKTGLPKYFQRKI